VQGCSQDVKNKEAAQGLWRSRGGAAVGVWGLPPESEKLSKFT